MIPDMIHTPYIAPRISVMAPPPVTAERFVDELLSGLCMPDGGFVAHLAPSGDPFSNGWNAAMKLQASQPSSRCLPMPVNVIFHNPATIVFWDDGDKTVVMWHLAVVRILPYYSILCGGSTPMCLLFSLIPGLSSRKSENLLRAVKTLRLSGLR